MADTISDCMSSLKQEERDIAAAAALRPVVRKVHGDLFRQWSYDTKDEIYYPVVGSLYGQVFQGSCHQKGAMKLDVNQALMFQRTTLSLFSFQSD